MNPLKPCPFCLTDGDERLIELWDAIKGLGQLVREQSRSRITPAPHA